MPHCSTPEPAHKPAASRWAVAAAVIASVDATFTLAGHGDHVAAWPLRIAAAVAAVGWLIRAAEARLAGALDSAVRQAWWMGYATCLEDQGEQGGKVVPLRPRSGDKISDTGRRLNGTEQA